MENKKTRIIYACRDGQSSRIMYNSLSSYADIECVIIENKSSGRALLQRRIKNIGIAKAIGQLFFLIFNKVLAKTSQARIRQLISNYGLDDKKIPSNITIRVDTINSNETINLIKKIRPDAVVINGTRIITNTILSSVDIPFINTHMGITPKYRGVHGGYWALANNDAANCGVTIHLVDKGIDTGGILYQETIHPEKYDNFNTYPIHQIARATSLMQKALYDVKEKKISIKKNTLPSHLWYHPTLLEYITNFIKKGIR